MGIERDQPFQHAEAAPHGALRIVFMRRRVAKIRQHAIAEILRNVAAKALDGLGASLVIGVQHLAEVFRIEGAGQASGGPPGRRTTR